MIARITHKLKPCKNSEFHGIKCVESNEEYGFFKDDIDMRLSSCTWISKENAERLYTLFREGVEDKP